MWENVVMKNIMHKNTNISTYIKIFFIFIFSCTLLCCSNSGSGNSNNNSAKDVISYALNGIPGKIHGNNIDVIMPRNTDLTHLIAKFSISGSKATINDKEQISEQTMNDFSSGLIKMRIIAKDGSDKWYTITLNTTNNNILFILSPTEKRIYAMHGGTSATQNNPSGIAITPNGKYAYVVNRNSNTVSIYNVATLNGTLVPIATVNTGNQPSAIVVSPSGNYAYVANNQNSTINVYSIDDITGMLSNIQTTSLMGDFGPNGLAINNKYLYVTAGGDDAFNVFQINSNGQLSKIVSIYGGLNPLSVIASPDQRFAYVTAVDSSYISMFNVKNNSATPLNPPTISMQNPSAIALNSINGTNYVYVANQFNNTISMFNASQLTGILHPLSESTISTGNVSNLDTLVVTPNHQYVYAIGNSQIAEFSVNQNNGQLQYLNTMTIGNGDTTQNLNTATISPNGNYLYVLDSTYNQIFQYNIGNDGQLTANNNFIIGYAATGTEPGHILVNGNNVYVTNYKDNTVSMYSFNSSGIESLGVVATGNGPRGMMTVTNSYAYIANELDSTISYYHITSTGLLNPLGIIKPAGILSSPISIIGAVGVSNYQLYYFMYITSCENNSVYTYGKNSQGTFTAIPGGTVENENYA